MFLFCSLPLCVWAFTFVFSTMADDALNVVMAQGHVCLLLEALSEARSGMISFVTSSSCYFSTVHEGYHRCQKSCAVLHVPAWLATRGNLHMNMRIHILSTLLFLWRSLSL